MIEIFNEISQRIVKGLMFHQEMADYFDFLNLKGLKRWHEYQFIEENCNLRKIHRYAINNLNKLINDSNIENVRYIPANWYNYTRLQVDPTTRKQAVRDAFEKWYNWEKETKEFYEKKFKTLTDNYKIAEADKINSLILSTNEELKYVTRKMLEYKATDYNMEYILYQQDEIHDYYEQKLKDNYDLVIY